MLLKSIEMGGVGWGGGGSDIIFKLSNHTFTACLFQTKIVDNVIFKRV